MKMKIIALTTLVSMGSYSLAATHDMNMASHTQHENKTVLSEAGNDAFGTIQEVIEKLTSNPNTDWSKVDLEKLRKHLVDMNNMTLNVNIVSQKNIQQGLEVVIEATTKGSQETLKRVFEAHPPQLNRDTGWHMVVTNEGERFRLTTTTTNQKDIVKIRGLGYIGLMAYGRHHQKHHWEMAIGKNPHQMKH